MPKSLGNTSSSRKLYIAGMSMRFMRSPLAPKKTMLHGSWIRLESMPARNGLGRARAAGAAGRFSVAAEVSLTGDLRRQRLRAVQRCLPARSNRVAVFAPLRPNPIIPSCTKIPFLRRLAALGASTV